MLVNDTNQIIKEISKEALEALDKTATPALPPYYAKAFLEVTAQKENSVVNDVMTRLGKIDLVKKNEDTLEESVAIARNSLLEYSTSTNRLKHIASDNSALLNLENLSPEVPALGKTLEELKRNYTLLNDEIRKAEVTIMKLEEDLEKAELETFIDPLTRLRTRVLLDKQLDAIFAGKENGKEDMWLALVEIDNYDNLSAEHGYAVMEKIVLFMAKSLQNTIRSENRIYRAHENCFAIVFNRMEKDAVVAAAERIRQRVEVSKLVYAEKIISITVTMVLSSSKKDDTTRSIKQRVYAALDDLKTELGNTIKIV